MGEREPGLTPDLVPVPAEPDSGLEAELSPIPEAGRELEMSEANIWVIDDIEAGIASLEAPDGRFFEIPAGWLPLGAAAADVLRVIVTSTEHGAVLTLCRDDGEVQRRLDEAEDRLERLRQHDPGGNINL